MFGGFVDGDRVNTTYKFNFKSGEWCLVKVNVENMPSARAGHSSVVDDKYIYVFGGKDNNDQKLNDLWRFDVTTEDWEQVKYAQEGHIPIGRTGHTCAVYNGHLLVFGGIYETTKELNDFHAFNL